MDLGSAVLSAKLALDLLPSEMSEKIRFCGAPLVEGAVAAAVQIGLTNDLDAICREASAALAPKREQLGEEATSQVSPPLVPDEFIRIHPVDVDQPARLACPSGREICSNRGSLYGECHGRRFIEREGSRLRS